jgi:hypothetical protein
LNFFFLCDVADQTERFAAAVRAAVSPRFFATSGRFLVHDSMEMRGRGPAFSLDRGDIDAGIAKWLGQLADIKKKYTRGANLY